MNNAVNSITARTLLVACLAGGLAASGANINWNGKGDGTSWSVGGNWQGGNAPTASDRAVFLAGDDLVLNLNDSGTADFAGFAVSSTRKVTVNSDAGAMLRIAANDDSYWYHVVLSAGSELVLNVPLTCSTGKPLVVYNQKTGIARFNSIVSNGNNTVVSIVGGTNYFASGSGLYAPNSTCSFGVGHYDPGWQSLVSLIGDAFVSAGSVRFGREIECCSADFVQDGAETRVEVSGGVTMGWNGTFASQHHKYHLKSGTLNVGGEFEFTGRQTASYYQSGGTATVASVSFGSGANNCGEFSVSGGRFECKGAFTLDSNAKPTFSFSDCTFAMGETSNVTISRPTRLSGTVEFEIPAGRTLTIGNATVAAGTQILQSGGGTLKIYPGGECRFDSEAPLSLGDMQVAPNDAAAVVVDEGCEVTVPSLTFAGNLVSRGTFKVLGGSFTSSGAVTFSGSNYGVVLSNCTFGVGADSTVPVAVALHSNVMFNVASGATLTLSGETAFAPDVKIVKTGAGTLRFSHDLVMRGDIDIREGRVAFTKGYTFENAYGDESVRRIYIRSSGNLYVDNYTAEMTIPRDVYVEDGGYIYIGDRSLFPVRHLYTNGVAVSRGVYYANTGNATLFRGSTVQSVLAIPYIWTGAGGNTSYSNTANWEGRATPGNATSISPYDATPRTRYAYLDLSAATNVVVDISSGNVITIGGIIYNPNSGPRRLLLGAKFTTGNMNAIRFNRGNYEPCCFVGPGRELVFDDVSIWQEGSSDFAFHGSGTYYIQGDKRPFAFKKTFFNHNILPASKIVMQYLTNRVDAGQFVPPMFTCYGGGENDKRSEVVFGPGFNVSITNFLFGSGDGYSCIRQYCQKPGSILTTRKAFITGPHQNKRGTGTYFMEGGELVATVGFYVGSMFENTSTYRQYPWGDFQMTGGILRAQEIGCENNQNWMHFIAGDVYVGSGGFVKTVATRSNASWRVFNENTTPCVQWGGGTIHATDDFTFGLDAALSGRGGNATLDTAGHTVTFTAKLEGGAALVKTGEGEMAMDGTLGAVRLAVEMGTVSFGANASQTASLEMLAVPSDSALTVAADKSISVKKLLVGGVSKTAGSYSYGDGTVVVEGDAGWLAEAPYSAAYTAVCDDAKALSALSYSCAVVQNGTLTVSGSGSIAFAANSTIYVRTGDTLRIRVPVTLAGTLTIAGGGTVVFEDAGVISRASGTSTAYVYATGGSTAVVKTVANGGESGIEFFATTTVGSAALSKLRVEDGGSICQVYSPTTGSPSGSGIGGVLEIAAGGTFRFKNATANIGGGATRIETLRLCGGTLRLSGKLERASAGEVHLIFDSGTVQVDGSSMQILPEMEVVLGGEVTFDVNYSAVQQVSLKCDFTGSGSIRKTGTGMLGLYGDVEAVEDFFVDEGVLCITENSATAIGADAAFHVSASSELALEYEGIVQTRALFLGSRQLLRGVYGEGVSPTPRTPAITGSGFMEFRERGPQGSIVIIM